MDVLVLLYLLAFKDWVDCTVQAQIYKSTEEEIIDVKRVDLCTGIRVTTDEHQIVLWSPHAWVTILIPTDKGWRRFQYRWKSELAHIESDTVPVKWGYTIKG